MTEPVNWAEKGILSVDPKMSLGHTEPKLTILDQFDNENDDLG